MRKVILSLCGLASLFTASAQLTAGANLNYTKYGGDVSKGTSGVGVRLGYAQERYEAVLSFTNGFAVTEKGSVMVTNNSSGANKNVATEGKLTFKTISFMGQRTLIGDDESTGTFYLGFGAGFVLAKYSEQITEGYDKNAYTAPEMAKESTNGLTINGAVGGTYKLGRPSIFAEAGFALPANQVNNAYVDNVIPAHFMVNVGVKFSLARD